MSVPFLLLHLRYSRSRNNIAASESLLDRTRSHWSGILCYVRRTAGLWGLDSSAWMDVGVGCLQRSN